MEATQRAKLLLEVHIPRDFGWLSVQVVLGLQGFLGEFRV